MNIDDGLELYKGFHAITRGGTTKLPNRVLKESIKRSPQIDQLSWFEEVVFSRLIVTVDDFGCYDGRTIVLRNDLFPCKESVTKKSVDDALKKLIEVGLVEQYVVDEQPYIRLLTWEKHQRMDKAKHKYPPPKEGGENRAACASGNFQELPGTSRNFPPESNPNPIRIQSESGENAYAFFAEPENPNSAKHGALITLPLNDKSEFPIFDYQVQEWSALYPAVDVAQELRNMRGWLLANPQNRKTERGINRFIANWLKREQDRSGNRANQNARGGTRNGYPAQTGRRISELAEKSAKKWNLQKQLTDC